MMMLVKRSTRESVRSLFRLLNGADLLQSAPPHLRHFIVHLENTMWCTSICNELFTWADVYDTANHDERRAILQQFIKEIRVRKDYEVSITLNASFNQVEQLKAVSTYDGAEIFEGISERGA